MFKKRILCTIISILMVLSILPIGVHAADSQTANNTNDTITIYFCNNKSWENAYIYAFYGDIGSNYIESPLGEWPGTKMNYVETNEFDQNIYSIEIPADVDYIKFNDGTPENNRTDSIPNGEFKDNTLFCLTEKVIKYWNYETYDVPDPVPVNKGKIYFENSKNWKKIYAYCYDENGHLLGAWPGTPCTYEKDNIWSVEVTGTPKGIFFNSRPDGVQTNEIPFIGYNTIAVLTGTSSNSYTKDAHIMTLAEYDEYLNKKDNTEEKVEIKGKVYFEDSECWGNIYAFSYDDRTGELSLGAWPGTPCTYEGNNIWSIELTDEPEGLLFNNPISGYQTNEIPFIGFDATAIITGEMDYNRIDAEFFYERPVTKKGVNVEGKTYDVKVGDTVTYEVLVTADKLFEDIQATVRYDSSKLKTEAISYSLNDGEGTNCPNLKYVVYNSTKDNIVKFNASYIKGMDFREEKVLLTIDFEVINDNYSEIKLDIEEMTIKGDGSESYFTDGNPVTTKGLNINQVLKIKENNEVTTETGIKVDDKIYDVKADETVTYEVLLSAERLFENVQATITYDADKLELLTTKGTEACPNIANGLVFNTKEPGTIRFNASFLEGYNFTEEKVLVTLNFKVKDNTLSEISTLMEEMTIMGDASQSYFEDGKPAITDGITVKELIKTKEPATDAEIVVNGNTYTAKVGDKVNYKVWLTAEKLFEDIQVEVSYDSEKLATEFRAYSGNNGPDSNCPNLPNHLFNSQKIGSVKMVSSDLNGNDFRSNKVLLTLDFEVIAAGRSEIELNIEEMTIMGDGTESYFTDGKPAITKGITVTEVLTTNDAPTITYILGDASGDDKVNVKDSTVIQKSTAGLTTLDEIQRIAADTDANEKVNIKDATVIQKHVAGVGVSFPIGTTKIV